MAVSAKDTNCGSVFRKSKLVIVVTSICFHMMFLVTVERNTTLRAMLENKTINVFQAAFKYYPDNTHADKIIKLRNQNGLSQIEFAKRIGVAVGIVINWECGANNVKSDRDT